MKKHVKAEKVWLRRMVQAIDPDELRGERARRQLEEQIELYADEELDDEAEILLGLIAAATQRLLALRLDEGC